MKIFVMGGTGLIGSALVSRLTSRGDEVVLLTRRPAHAQERWGNQCTIVEGDPMKAGPWMQVVNDCEAVVNLVGESIFARRWNDEFKKLLRDSRINSTQNVVQALAQSPKTAAGNPKVLVNGSAIGYYGPCGDEELTEETLAGSDMLAQLAFEWELVTNPAEAAEVRVVRIRTGVVLDKNGGALPQMLTPFKLGLGGPIGSGKHWFSWIHIDDEVGIILLALDHPGAIGPIGILQSVGPRLAPAGDPTHASIRIETTSGSGGRDFDHGPAGDSSESSLPGLSIQVPRHRSGFERLVEVG